MTIRYEWVLRNEMELSNPTDAQAIVRTLAMTTGTDTGEANQLYHSRFTLEAEEENEIDLVGQLYNPLGEIISFGRIKRLLVINEGIKDESTTPTSYTVDANEDIYVGGGGSSGLAWAGLFNGDQDVKARVRAGGVLCWQDPAGVVVLPGAAEKILFTGIGAGPVTVSLIIEGTQ